MVNQLIQISSLITCFISHFKQVENKCNEILAVAAEKNYKKNCKRQREKKHFNLKSYFNLFINF